MARPKVDRVARNRIRKATGEEGELMITFMDTGSVKIETATLDGRDHREIWLSNTSAKLLMRELNFYFENKVEF